MVDPLPAGSRLLAEDTAPWTTEINALRSELDVSSSPPMVHLRQTTLMSLTNNAGTAITFTTEDVDTINGHSTSSNTSRYTPNDSGWYLLGGAVSFASNATGRRGTWWRKNGVDINGSETVIGASAAGSLTVPARTIVVQLNGTTDYVELMGFQDSGAGLNTAVTATQQPSMTAVKIYDT
jgi:hypothetical protein